MQNRLRVKIVLVLLGAVSSLLLVELGLRVGIGEVQGPERLPVELADENSRFFEYDETLGWKGKAFASGTYRGLGYAFSVRLNSQGLREREVPFEKTKDTLRIMILGDSQTWGLGVESEERFSEVLERLLRETGRNVEVLNFGMTGYGTDQELLLFRRLGVQYHPDIVIVGFYWNDLFENLLSMTYGYPKPQFIEGPAGSLELSNIPVPKKTQEARRSNEPTKALKDKVKDDGIWNNTKFWMTTNLFTYRLVADAIRQSTLLYQFSVSAGIAGGPRRDPESKEWRITRRLLGRLKEAVKDNGSNFLVLVIPERADLETSTHSLKRRLIDDMRNLPCLDLVPALRRAGLADALYYRNDIHLTAGGHRVIGQAIFEYLIQSHALDRS